MGNTVALPIIRLGVRLSMIFTLGCFAYVVYSLLFQGKDKALTDDADLVPAKAVAQAAPSPVFDLKPYDASGNDQIRDIFSLNTSVSPSGAIESTVKGQLPEHLKIVGILIAHPSQIIIEDGFDHKTYFIDESTPQDGIKIVRASQDGMTINYQGQDINVPIAKN
jgi:hypothetical protein